MSLYQMYDAVIDAVDEGHHFWVRTPCHASSSGICKRSLLTRLSVSVTLSWARRKRVVHPARRLDPARGRRSVTRTIVAPTAVDDRAPAAVAVLVIARGQAGVIDPGTRRDRSRAMAIFVAQVAVRHEGTLHARLGVCDITGDLLQHVRERERRKAEAVERDYASLPASYKGSLLLKLDRWTTRKRSCSPAKHEEVVVVQPGLSKARGLQSTSPSPEKEKTRETHEWLQKLRELYGDASTKPMDG
ncbi:hypothetical protein PsorP6_017000 [Peronosclerospora sorghi]|uniref:Uncharacterized protein n=1 Tax=Peronosclerospora sorghi TaxID=230839 RepID=A0ACC0WCR6_9STRA|nr:hypothetical protein PsorP6_017000 [Peronosclerospora sorghi]